MFKFRETAANPDWDYFLTISHTQTALVAYRKDRNSTQHYVGLIFRLSGGYGATVVPADCIGGCTCGAKSGKCINPAKKHQIFDHAVDAVVWVFQEAGMHGDIPRDLMEPPCFKEYDKRKSMNGGFWNGRIIYGNFPVADQSHEPSYKGPQPSAPIARPIPKANRQRQRPPQAPTRPSPLKKPRATTPASVEVQVAKRPVSIEEALDDAMKDLKEEFGFDGEG